MTTARTRSVVAALALTGGLGLGVVAASSAIADPPGNNGTVKVHELGTESDTPSNDPKVCAFNFEVFGLDAGQTGDIHIAPQGGDTDTTATLTVSLSTDANGDGKTVYINADPEGETDGLVLPEGHYKATLDNKFGTEKNGKAKSKVFKVTCDDEPTTPPTTSTTSTETTPPPTSSTTSSQTAPPTETSSTSSTTTETTPPSETSTSSTETTPPTTGTSSTSSTSSTQGTSTPSDTPSTPGATVTPPGGTDNPSGPPVQTDFLKRASDSNAALVAAGIVGLGAIVGAGYLGRRRLTD